MASPPDVRAVGRRIQPGQQVLRREMLEQGVKDLKIHALVAQGKLEMADKRVLDGDAAREKDAVGRIHSPIDRTADLRPLRQRSDDQRESADELCVANGGHRILEICLRDSKFINGRWSFKQSIREFIVTTDQ
jgi:hypothetical protein